LMAIPAEVKGKTGFDAIKANLARLNVCSQKGLVERFDSTIGAGTVHLPFAGKYQLTEEQAMTAKIPVLTGETDDASAMSYGFIPGMSKWSPFHGAIYSTVEAVSKLAAVGANPFKSRLTLQEYFEKLLDKKERWGKPVAALLGALTAQLELQIPAIGGKDSMSGSFNEMNVPPTLVCFAVSMTKASKVLSACFKNDGGRVYMLPVPIDEETLVPDWEKYRTLLRTVYEYVYGGKIAAASVVREGGSAYSVCSMAFGDKKGFKFENGLSEKTLYAPLAGSFVVELNEGVELPAEIEAILLGTVNNSGVFELGNESESVDNLIAAWAKTLEKVFPTAAADFTVPMTPEVKDYTFRSGTASSIKIAQPRVFIPVFPGTNCEYDTTRAFEQAGAKVKTLIVKNLSAAAIEETIKEISSSIAESQIVMLPGGFSGGDEPDGSGKFIATTFRNPYISEQVSELLKNRDGLMLGICNGFQALIKLGLVPYGKIVDISETSPTLTFNSIGRHVSCMTYTRVASVKSPWLMN
ncbi:MAG: phosphoribosylformylglycinamidine synthase subunit PurQ, partial [Clostridia bacterium]|nr:phosphoribosylformylglycinamidine synthase subunit PurQ [Clostridia bacterium]